MRIYVACLASYNAGRLHGRWIDASTDIDAMTAEVRAMLRESPCPNVMRCDYESDDGETIVVTHSFGEAFLPSVERDGKAYKVKGEPYASAEEWAIHDYEGLGPDLGEHAGLGEVARRVMIAEAAEERDIPLPVLLEVLRDRGEEPSDASEVEDFISDAYRGKYDTWRDFAQGFTEETNDMSAVPEWLQGHIDWDSVARDFEISGDFSGYRDGEHGGDLYIFWNH